MYFSYASSNLVMANKGDMWNYAILSSFTPVSQDNLVYYYIKELDSQKNL